MCTSLLDYLSKIPDVRRKQGQMYPLDKMLLLIFIGTLSGRVGYRSISRFCKDNEAYLSQVLDLRHGTPTHVTMTSLVEGVDYKSFEKAINDWSKSKFKQTKKSKKISNKKIVSLDGKAIKASVKNGTSNSQNFISFVNAFCINQEYILGSIGHETGKSGETNALRELVKIMGIKDVVFTMDALHASKKL